MLSITRPDTMLSAQIQDKINNKTKPLGSLGQLENVALQLALIQQTETISVNQPHLLVFAGDHGIAQHGLSIALAPGARQGAADQEVDLGIMRRQVHSFKQGRPTDLVLTARDRE